MFSFAKKLKDKLEAGAGSRHDTDSYFQSTLSTNNGGYGLRILHVNPESTAHGLQLEPWFDFIVGINGHELPMRFPGRLAGSSGSYSIGEDGSLHYGNHGTKGGESAAIDEASLVDFDLLAQELAMVASGPDKSASFTVWSAKGGVTRKVSLQLAPPSAKDSKSSTNGVSVNAQSAPELSAGNVTEGAAHDVQNDDTNKPPTLYKNCFSEIGLTVASQHVSTATHVWRILASHAHSPAFQAQLVPYADYIIGCDSAFPSDKPATGLLAGGGESLLGRTLSSYYTRHQATLGDDRIPVILHVYNHDFDVLRPVTVYLSPAWARGENKGILGCDVGYGLLHRLPEVVGKYGSSVSENGPVPGAPVADPVLITPAKTDVTTGTTKASPFEAPIADVPISHAQVPAPCSQAPISYPTVPVNQAKGIIPPPQTKPPSKKASNRYAPEKKPESTAEIGPETDGSIPSEKTDGNIPLEETHDNIASEETHGNTPSETVNETPKLSSEGITSNIPTDGASSIDAIFKEVGIPSDSKHIETQSLISEITLPPQVPSSAQKDVPKENTDDLLKPFKPMKEELLLDEDFLTEKLGPMKPQEDVEHIAQPVSTSKKPELLASPVIIEKQGVFDPLTAQMEGLYVSESPSIGLLPTANESVIEHESITEHESVTDNEQVTEKEPVTEKYLAPETDLTSKKDITTNSELAPAVLFEKSSSPYPISKIDSLLDEDEDFLVEDLPSETTHTPQENQIPVAEDPTMCEIPLTESAPKDPSHNIESKASPSPPKSTSVQPSVSVPVFSPMKPTLPLSPPSGPPSGPPSAKPGRRRKAHGPANIGSLADFMNEELSKSKANDVSYGSSASDEISNGIPPPPPKSVKR